MIGYVCKYAPVEVLAGFSLETGYILPDERDIPDTDGEAHQNICSYAKAVLAAVKRGGYEAVLVTDCCGAMKSVADILEDYSGIEVYRFSIPRVGG
jgi:benzoyl-CoA reductase/2-hydroxyglutaryl-CoA dehydratase subunit BcrC/BadD/HgdB